MSWVRLDDHFADHPKFLELGQLGPLAIVLQVRALCYAARHLTDGRIPAGALPVLLDSFPAWSLETGGVPGMFSVGTTADEFDWPAMMVAAGLWDHTEVGYAIHDYLEYNPAKTVVIAEREQKRAAGQARAAQADRKNGRFARPAEHQRPAGDPLREVLRPPSPAPTPTTASSSRGWGIEGDSLLGRLVSEPQREAVEGLLRAAQEPRLLAISMASYGPGGTDGRYTWAEIGQAALELVINGGGFTARRLAAFLRKVREGEPPARRVSGPGASNDAALMRAEREKLEASA